MPRNYNPFFLLRTEIHTQILNTKPFLCDISKLILCLSSVLCCVISRLLIGQKQDDSPNGNCNGHKTESEGVPYLANRPKFWRIFFWKIFFSKNFFLAKFLLRGYKNLGGGFPLFNLI